MRRRLTFPWLPIALGLSTALASVQACSANLESAEGTRAPSEGSTDAGADAGSGQEWRSELPPVDVECNDDGALALYERRIEPLFAEGRAASCNECHYSGLDMSVFLRDTPCESMACLVSQGLVDPENPEQSLVLDWIARAAPLSPLIDQEVIAEEYQGFREWIYYSAECDDCEGVTCTTDGEDATECPNQTEPRSGYDPSELDPGGCEEAALVEVFRTTVYATRGRCSPCHYDTSDPEKYQAPQWLSVTGDCESAARRTYWNVVDRGYIDVDEPENSLLLLKPLSEDLGGVVHGGHDKFWSKESDPGYASFLYFMERFGACQ